MPDNSRFPQVGQYTGLNLRSGEARIVERLISALTQAGDLGLITDADTAEAGKTQSGRLTFADGGGGTVSAGDVTLRWRGRVTDYEWVQKTIAVAGGAYGNPITGVLAYAFGRGNPYGLYTDDAGTTLRPDYVRSDLVSTTANTGYVSAQIYTKLPHDPAFLCEVVDNTTNLTSFAWDESFTTGASDSYPAILINAIMTNPAPVGVTYGTRKALAGAVRIADNAGLFASYFVNSVDSVTGLINSFRTYHIERVPVQGIHSFL